MKSDVSETDLSDYHKMAWTSLFQYFVNNLFLVMYKSTLCTTLMIIHYTFLAKIQILSLVTSSRICQKYLIVI